MDPRRTILTAAVAGLLGGAAWWLMQLPAADGGVTAIATPSAAVSAVGPGNRQLPATFPIRQATTPAEVREVLRITKTATLQDRPALLDAALRVQDPLIAGNAAQALGRLRVFTCDPALLALTADPRLRVRQDAVRACGLDGGTAAIPYLQQALVTGDASLRPLVLAALGKIGGPISREELRRVAKDPNTDETDRVFARSALAGPATSR